MPSAMAQRPQPVIMPAAKAMTPMVARATGGQGSASWIAEVEISARENPNARVRALTRQGEGQIGDAGRNGAERHRLTGDEAEDRRGGERDHKDAGPDAHAVDDMLADQHPGEIGQAPAGHRAERSGAPGAAQRLDRARGGRIEAGAAFLDESDKLADHLRGPIRTQMRRRP